MSIYPKTIFNLIEGRYVVWIKGENRTGKTLLALDIADEYLQAGFRYLSNTTNVWNDDLPLELDENNMLNLVVNLDEVGVSVRTKESIRSIMGFKGKLNTIFLLTGTEEPHEDLWRFYIEPMELLNGLFSFLFGDWITERYIRFWRWVIFNPSPNKPDRSFFFVQTLQKNFFQLYSTLNPFNDPSFLLSQFEKSLQDLHEKTSGQSSPIELLDMATKRRGMGEAQSFFRYQVDRKSPQGKRGLFPAKKEKR